MLSKSQARLFFLIATVGFSGVFLWLTIDSVRQVAARSNAENLTEEVVRGKEIWEHNNCMGCHTLLGEGAYYAPELTKVVERRGKEWMRVFLKDPQAMYPGRRKMVQYNFTDEEIEDVISFFEWIGEIDTNGFPREPDMAPAQVTTVAAASGPKPPAMFSTICAACHSYAGSGGNVGPALDGVGDRYDRPTLRKWLADPAGVKPGTAMPNLNLTDAQLDELTDFLMASSATSGR
ncbi:MAG: c-type cytochrome [Deltaproteobacteria bacterium]|nr:c-type cytochrome [Deltaproteobacteria bacterium]